MSSLDPQLIDRLHLELVSDLERMGVSPRDIQRELVEARIELLLDRATASPDPAVRRLITDRVFARLAGLGPLQPLLDDPTVTEIMVNNRETVFVERDGKLARTAVNFGSDSELLHLINRIVAQVGRRIDASSPLVDARLPDGSRVHAAIPPLALAGPTLTIRRFGTETFSIRRLLSLGALSEAMAAFLEAVVVSKHNIIISGGTGSGKTSFLNALGALVPAEERLVIIEDVHEIRLAHPNQVILEARPPNIEGRGEVTIRTLLKNALRMRPDRIVIGEVRAAEALDMLQAMNTGHQGSLGTVHANAPLEALFRIETMALMAEVELPLPAIREQIRSAVNFLVHLERFPDGSRRVTEISELEPDHRRTDSSYRLRPLFLFDKGSRTFRSTGRFPHRPDRFAFAGVPLDPRWFRGERKRERQVKTS